MDLAELQKKLIAAARADMLGGQVPYAFEKRITALLAARRVPPDNLALWVYGLWRAAASCVAVAAVCGVFSLLTPAAADNRNDLSQDFENTLLASVDQGDTAQ
jgi:hypothetical protein